jgi:hypothetical protein
LGSEHTTNTWNEREAASIKINKNFYNMPKSNL